MGVRGILCLILLSAVVQNSLQAKLLRLTFAQKVLSAHNYYRALHNAPPLTLNPELSQMANKWAHHLNTTKARKHSQNGYGENIYWASNRKLGPSDAVEAWYNEISLYNWWYPSYSKHTGHFTQVVWKGSTELGVGFAKRGKTIIVVCNYNPPGNYENKFRRNVGLPRKIYGK